MRAEFGSRIKVYDWVQAGNAIDGAALLINTTSLGMAGQPSLRIPLDALTPDVVVTDLVYAPVETPLLQQAQKLGCRTVDGLGMLLHQAAPGFERWFGLRPEVDEKTRAVVLGL